MDVLSEIILTDITSLKERPLYLGLYALPMAGGGPIDSSFRSKLRRLDWIGMLLFTIGSTSFALPLSWAGAMYPWLSWRTILPFIVGATVLIAFGIYESKPVEPIFPYRIFRNRTAVVTLIGATTHGAVLYSVLLYPPLFFQAVMLQTPFRSAVSVLPISACTVGFSIFGVVAVELVRRYRWGVIVSGLFMALGVGLWALWRSSSSKALLFGLQVMAAIGVGTLFTILTIPMTASVQHVDDMGIAAGILVSFRLFGALTGLAICSGIFSNVFAKRIASIGTLPQPVEILKDVREAIGFIPKLRSLNIQPKVLEQVIEAYRVSIIAVFLTLAGIGAVGFLASSFTKELTLEREDRGRQRFEKSA